MVNETDKDKESVFIGHQKDGVLGDMDVAAVIKLPQLFSQSF